jgi:hypothetical protein
MVPAEQPPAAASQLNPELVEEDFYTTAELTLRYAFEEADFTLRSLREYLESQRVIITTDTTGFREGLFPDLQDRIDEHLAEQAVSAAWTRIRAGRAYAYMLGLRMPDGSLRSPISQLLDVDTIPAITAPQLEDELPEPSTPPPDPLDYVRSLIARHEGGAMKRSWITDALIVGGLNEGQVEAAIARGLQTGQLHTVRVRGQRFIGTTPDEPLQKAVAAAAADSRAGEAEPRLISDLEVEAAIAIIETLSQTEIRKGQSTRALHALSAVQLTRVELNRLLSRLRLEGLIIATNSDTAAKSGKTINYRLPTTDAKVQWSQQAAREAIIAHIRSLQF